MSNDLKKVFLQKYKLDNYSSAIPTKVLSDKTVTLGEYCEPIDARKLKSSVDEDYNSDPDYRYAQPQDAIHLEKGISKLEEDDTSPYKLAKHPSDDHNVNSTRKPSPKPRSAKHRHQGPEDSPGVITDKDRLSSSQISPISEPVTKDKQKYKMSAQEPQKRPGKKVVEIEYEVASAITSNQLNATKTKNPLTATKSDSHTSINPSNKKAHLSQPDVHISKVPSKSTQQPRPDFVYSMGKPPGAGEEVTYEEPWDLKMKRLKQEQEKKDKEIAKKAEPQIHSLKKVASVYEDARESLQSKQSCGRSISQTSETEVFVDALDNVQSQAADIKKEQSKISDGALKPLPSNTYEDAWDLKNSLLELKIREMQLQASATYEEPWDSSKQQKHLQAKYQSQISMSGGEKPNDKEAVARHKSISDANDTVWEGTESKATVVRGKYHSVDESRIKLKSRSSSLAQRIDPTVPLTNQNWYHGNISRDDAEKMLCVCKEGSYIVRTSSDRKSYSLSIKSSKQYIHVQIEQINMEDGSIRYILGKNSKEFCSIPEMIDYYTQHRVPLKGTEHIFLLHPVECKWS